MAFCALCVITLLTGCANDQEGSQTVATESPAETNLSNPYLAGQAAGECLDFRSDPQALIEIHDFRFDPPCLDMTTAQGFVLRNKGDSRHNFSIEGFAGIDVDLEPGQENNTEPPGLDAGDYTYFCKYHRDQGMEGGIRVARG